MQTIVRMTKKTLSDRKRDFALEIASYKDKYPRKMLVEFYDYWTERNPNGLKMKFEKIRTKSTFHTGRRLATWFKNYKPKQDEKLSVTELLKRKHGISDN